MKVPPLLWTQMNEGQVTFAQERENSVALFNHTFFCYTTKRQIRAGRTSLKRDKGVANQAR